MNVCDVRVHKVTCDTIVLENILKRHFSEKKVKKKKKIISPEHLYTLE